MSQLLSIPKWNWITNEVLFRYNFLLCFKHACCIFQPSSGCCTLQTLVEICSSKILWSIFWKIIVVLLLILFLLRSILLIYLSKETAKLSFLERLFLGFLKEDLFYFFSKINCCIIYRKLPFILMRGFDFDLNSP